MASSVSIDVESSKNGDDLQFQDIPHDDKWKPVGRPEDDQAKTHTFTNFPHSAVDSDNEEDESEKTEFLRDKKNASFWTFEYYQQFFDVETAQVGLRILGSMIPRPGGNYLDKHIRPNPDLYGPFWICTTLVFTTAIAGNLANYIQAAGERYEWAYDFHKVTFAATAIFSYWWVIPLLLFGLLWWRGNQGRYTFLELLCVYGYSLAIYIPISILWVIQISWLQWLLVVLGTVLSGSALVLVLWPALKEDKKQVALTVLTIAFLLHAALAMGFMLYFFHVPSQAPVVPGPGNITTTLSALPLQQALQDPPVASGTGQKVMKQEPEPAAGSDEGTGAERASLQGQKSSSSRNGGVQLGGTNNDQPRHNSSMLAPSQQGGAIGVQLQQDSNVLAPSQQGGANSAQPQHNSNTLAPSQQGGASDAQHGTTNVVVGKQTVLKEALSTPLLRQIGHHQQSLMANSFHS